LRAAEGQPVHYGIRPGDITLADAGVPAQVVVVEPTGAETELLLQVGGAQLKVMLHGRTEARPDDTVHLAVDGRKAHVFDGHSGQRL
jgi:multiple sugar transport system ATP-binding protein